MRKNRAVSNNGKSLSLVNLVTWWKLNVKDQNKRWYTQSMYTYDTKLHMRMAAVWLCCISCTPCEYYWTWCDCKQQVRGYESCHDSSRYSQSKGSTEDTQEDAKGLQQGHGLKAVAVVSCRLVRHDGAEGRRDREVDVSIYTENANEDKEWWKATDQMFNLTFNSDKTELKASNQICNNPIPIRADVTSQVFLFTF